MGRRLWFMVASPFFYNVVEARAGVGRADRPVHFLKTLSSKRKTNMRPTKFHDFAMKSVIDRYAGNPDHQTFPSVPFQ